MNSRLFIGDCREVMSSSPAESVEAIVTDPPYGLSFMGKGWDKGVPGVDFWLEALRVLKPGGHMLAFGGTRTFHRMAVAIEDAGFEIRDAISWLYGSGFPKSHDVSKAIDKAGGSEAEKWKGWGTALKPAWEPIIVARKPFKGTVANNVLTYGVGAINVDACRIPTSDSYVINTFDDGAKPFGNGAGHEYTTNVQPAGGRWPANVVLDEDAAVQLDETVGERKSGGKVQGHETSRTGQNGIYGHWERVESYSFSDTGGASRFFYCAKASRSERNKGLEDVPVGDRPLGISNWTGQTNGSGEKMGPPSPQANHHPTVKPVALMQWLVRMVTPPGGLVLDPFVGSGSTGVAAVLEGFDFYGIDLSEEYLAIAHQRIDHAMKELTE